MKTWNTAGTMTWFFLFFIVLSYEIWAGINHGQHIPMLTQVVVRYIPWPFTLGFIVWLFLHFAVRYASKKYRDGLKGGGSAGIAGGLALGMAMAGLALTATLSGAPPKKVSRTYWKHSIAELAAEDPQAWHKMHTHVRAEGFVVFVKSEDDGDTHIRLCESAIATTMDRERCIVAECIPKLPCAKPKVGERAAVEGISRFDAEGACVKGAQHCWWEIHPVEKLEVLP